MCTRWWSLRGVRGDAHALPRRVVIPSVVRANQAAVLNAAAGKPRAAMQTKIFPRAKPFVAAPEDEVLPKEPRRPDFVPSHVRGSCDHVPIVHQNGIIDHSEECCSGTFLQLNSQENTTGELVDSSRFFLSLASRFCIVAVMAFVFEG